MNNIEQQNRREKWKAIVEDHNKSGLSQVDYCKKHSLSPSQFTYYRGLLAQKEAKVKTAGTFAQVKVNQQPSSPQINLTLPNGFQCTFPCDLNRTQIKELVEALLSC
ncbi:MAG: hypothetical protein ABI597_11755 [Gammaproteobacteria bacterium]